MKKSMILLLCIILIMGLAAALPVSAAEETQQQEHKHCVCGGAAQNVADHICQDVQTWTGIRTAADIPASGGNVYLVNDVTITNTITLKDGQTLNICLNGKKLTIDNTASRIFNVEKGTLSICDCSYDAGTDTFAGSVVGMRTGYWAAVANVAGTDSKLYVYGGNYSNGSENGTNLFYINSSGTMYLYNGHITGGSIASNSNGGIEAGGIWLPNGNLYMHGGTITGGYGANAGGIALQNASSMVMTGGTVTGNTANNANRGDIFLSGNGTCSVTLSGDCQIGWIFVGAGKRIQVAAAGMGSQASVGVFLASGDYPNNPLAAGRDTDAWAFRNVSVGTSYTVAAEYNNYLYFCQTTAHVHCVCNGAAADGRGGHICGRKWFFTLQPTTTKLPANGNYFLNGDVTLEELTTISGGNTLSICLNGHKLTSTTTAVFGSCRRATLNVCDHKVDGVYAGSVQSGTNASTSGSIIQAIARYQLNIYGGNWINNTPGARAIRMTCNSPYENPDTLQTSMDDPYNASVLNFSAGTISGGNAPFAGGNIALVNAAKMNMYGGTVTGGKGTTGGNICLSNSATVFNGFGGTVQNGTGTNGGNICGLASSTVNLQGTAVVNGTASGNGGNVYTEGTLNITGSITGGTAVNGGNIYAKGTSTIANAVISGGSVSSNGGNVANYGTMTITDSRLVDGIAENDTQSNGLGANLHTGAASTTTISGCSFTGGFANQGGNVSCWGSMSISDSTLEEATAKYYGWNILVYGASADLILNDVEVYNTAAASTGEAEDEQNAATAVRVATGSKLTLKNVLITGTKDHTILNQGAVVMEGTVSMPGDNLDLLIDGGDVSVDIAGLTATGESPITVKIDGNKAGKFAVNATDAQKALFTSWNSAYYVSYADAALQLTAFAIQVRNNAEVLTGYATWQEAMADTTEGITYYMLTDDVDGGNITKDIILDLAGNNLTNVIIPEGVTVYGMDSTTDDYDCSDGYGTISGTVNGTIATNVKTTVEQCGSVKRYLTVTDNGVTSFHRFYMGVTHMNLRPGVTGVGYKALFCGDSVVQQQVVSYGFNLWVADGNKYNAAKTELNSGKTVSLRLENFDVANYGEADVNATVFMQFANGVVVESNTYSYTLRSLVEQINGLVESFTEAQMSALKAMCAKNADAMSGWDIDNIRNWTKPEATE